MTKLRFVLSMAVLAVAAACGGSDDEAESTSPEAAASTDAADSTDAEAVETSVAVQTTTEETDPPETTERPTTTTTRPPTTTAPTTTRPPTTTAAPQPAFSVTVPMYTQSWNDLWSLAAQLTSPNSLAPLNPQPAGNQLYGSALNGEVGMYMESDSADGLVNAVIVALAPGNTSTPARLLAARRRASFRLIKRQQRWKHSMRKCCPSWAQSLRRSERSM